MALPRDTSVTSSPPSAFGRYRVVHQVGAGVLGPVFRGYDPEHDRAVAIKAFSLDLTPEQARDLAADLERLSTLALGHPSIIAPLGSGADGSTAYLVEEYFVAESADVALKQYGPAPVPDAMRVVGQLAGALDVAAAALVYHGALHPRDILVAPHEVRLTGLGVVAALERVGFRTAARRPYAAPERLSGGPFGPAADIFSLACVSFELVTGRRPTLSGDTVTVDTDALQAADAGALAETFARALSSRPDDRHPSALSFAAALKHALTGEPLQTPAEPERPRPRRGAKGGRKPPTLSLDADRAEPSEPSEPASDASDAFVAGTDPQVQVAAEPGMRPEDLPLAPPPDTPSSDDGSAELPPQETSVESAPVEPPPDQVGSTPLPAFFEAYRVVAPEDTEPAVPVSALAPEPNLPDVDRRTESTMAIPLIRPKRTTPQPGPRVAPAEPALPGFLERAAFVPPTDERTPDREAADKDPTDKLPGDKEPTDKLPARQKPSSARLEVEPSVVQPAAGPLRLEDLEIVRPSSAPAEPPHEHAPMFASGSLPPGSSVAKPRAALIPMLAMLLVGILIGFPTGYLVAPRQASVPPASATAASPAALTSAPASGAEHQSDAVPPTSQPVGAPADAAALPAASAPAVQPTTSQPAGVTIEAVGAATPGTGKTLTARQRRAARLKAERDAARAEAGPAGTGATIGARKANPPRATTTFEGSLLVESKPPGAAVTLDGHPVGKTPLTLSTVAAGSHAVRLDLTGYNVWSSAIQVSAGQQSRVTASLERRPGG